jgi:hypothetical protein
MLGYMHVLEVVTVVFRMSVYMRGIARILDARESAGCDYVASNVLYVQDLLVNMCSA